MKPEDFNERVQKAISEENSDSLGKLIEMIREDISESDRKFLRLSSLLGLTILVYHLYAFGYLESLSMFGGELSKKDLFVKCFLVFPSGVYLFLTAVGYTRIYQKRLFELLIEKQYQGFYQTDLELLLQKPNFMLSMDYLRREPGFGKLFWKIIASLPAGVFTLFQVFAPIIYILVAFQVAFNEYGSDDLLLAISALLSGLFIFCGFMVFRKSTEVLGSL